jgi:heme exporter protein C
MQTKPVALKALDALAIILLGISTYLALVWAPTEASMGAVQRVFYFHVATAWVGMLGFIAAIIPAIIYLRTQDLKWDRMEVAAIEISVVFFFLAIVLGSIWARPAWNTWWKWEPRLTTAAITELLYIAYFMLRQGIDDPERRARFGAVYALVAAASVPITFMSIRWIDRTLHPVVIGGSSNPEAAGTFAMSADMRIAFFFALFAFTVIFIDLFWNRIRLGNLQNRVEELKLQTTT